MVKVTAEKVDGSGEELKAETDADIEAFNEAFRNLGNDALTRSERAILSTYLYWKIKGGFDAKGSG